MKPSLRELAVAAMLIFAAILSSSTSAPMTIDPS